MAVSEEVQQKVAGLMRALLDERFMDGFVFDPIIVQSEFDEYDDEYLHVYVIYEGDLKNLDPGKTAGLSGLLWEDVAKLGYPHLPSRTFIEKSDWRKVFEKKYRETGRVR